ncbi:hypothetical protein GCM10023147_17740 [Tsukamurella soli]|uniref:Uncharacterized protein n=1 Tax=Tsukamurella soli TaxID=644556 RepID=A0ABP8JFU7_9ACTN
MSTVWSITGRLSPPGDGRADIGQEAGYDSGHLPIAGEAEGHPVHGQVPVRQGVEVDARDRDGEAADIHDVPILGRSR